MTLHSLHFTISDDEKDYSSGYEFSAKEAFEHSETKNSQNTTHDGPSIPSDNILQAVSSFTEQKTPQNLSNALKSTVISEDQNDGVEDEIQGNKEIIIWTAVCAEKQ